MHLSDQITGIQGLIDLTAAAAAVTIAVASKVWCLSALEASVTSGAQVTRLLKLYLTSCPSKIRNVVGICVLGAYRVVDNLILMFQIAGVLSFSVGPPSCLSLQVSRHVTLGLCQQQIVCHVLIAAYIAICLFSFDRAPPCPNVSC